MDIVQVAKDFAKAQATIRDTKKELVEFFRFNNDVDEIAVEVDGDVFKVSLVVCGGGLLPGGYGLSVSKVIVDPDILKLKKK